MIMTARPDDIAVVTQLARRWNIVARAVAPGDLHCRTGIVGASVGGKRGFAYLSLVSAFESLPFPPFDLTSGRRIELSQLGARLLGGETVALLLGKTAGRPTGWALPSDIVAARERLRLRLVELRFLLRQAGLEEVATDRGASDRLVNLIRDIWCPAASISLDVSMLLALGADRQRYVDVNYERRATVRLTALARRLHSLGVRSNSLLVMG